MSKISVTTIAGLTSGGDANTVKIESGDAFNVVSGATTLGGATTISGDLAVDTNVLKVDSSNNRVGIGTTSPSYTLHSTTSSGSDFAGFFHNSAGSGNGTALIAKGGANNSGAGTFIVQDYGGNEDFKVDGLGRVTMPNQPAFHIQGTGPSHSGGSETAIYYVSTPTIKMNIGNHGVGGTDASTSGKFTCPVAGMYYFEVRWYRGNTGSPTRYMGTNVKKNGVTFVPYYYNNAAGTSSYGDQSVAASGIIQCAANDVLQQYVYSYSGDADPGTTMQIYLLG